MTTTLLDQHRVKAYAQTRFKAEGDDVGDGSKLGPGEFLAIASVFGNVDKYGERVVKGAFAETLQEWSAKGDPIPVIWYHQWTTPEAHIGYVVSAQETDEGLVYRGKLDIEDNPFAAQVYRLMKGRRVTQQSFGFDVLDGRTITEDGEDVYEITRLALIEVGPCLVGVNPETSVLEVKAQKAAESAPTTEPAPAPAPAQEPAPQTPEAPASGEPSGQVSTDPSAASSASHGSGSDPEEPASTKGLSPASTKLILEAMELETEE